MSGPLPHSSELQRMVEEYLNDANSVIVSSLRRLKHSSEFRMVYRVSLAADAVLSNLSNRRIRPHPSGIRSIVLRIPLLVAVRQTLLAKTELRRFNELIFWSIYFTEHPVEWASFERSPDKGFSRNTEKPIDHSAHREFAFYANYASERVLNEPSGISTQAIDDLRKVQGELNAAVHAGNLVSTGRRIPPVDSVSAESLKKFGKLQRRVFSRGCILMAAIGRRQFDTLQPSYRAHFDWIVGRTMAKRIRSGPFGL